MTIDGKPDPACKLFTEGVKITGPQQPNDWHDHDCYSENDLEANILHLSDLLNDVKDGKVAGPFKLGPNTKYATVEVKPGVYKRIPLIFASRHCCPKAKRMQSKGRRVSDLTANGINELQDPKRRPVNNLPSLRFILSMLSDKTWLFDYDLSAAYRQIPYSKSS